MFENEVYRNSFSRNRGSNSLTMGTSFEDRKKSVNEKKGKAKNKSGFSFNLNQQLSEVFYDEENMKLSDKFVKFIVSCDGLVYEVINNEIGEFSLHTKRVVGAQNIKEKSIKKTHNLPKFFKEIYSSLKSIKDFNDLNKEELEEIVGYHKTLKSAQESDKPINYCFDSKGLVYEVSSNLFGDIIKKTDNVLGAPKISNGFKLNLPKKIPIEIYDQVLKFFIDICDDMGDSEAHVQIYWDREKREYFPYVPEQEVSVASVDYGGEWEEVKSKNLLVAEIHSHNNMSAVPSSIDRENDKENIFYMIMGKVKDKIPETSLRFIVNNIPHFIEINDLFEVPLNEVSYPSEWKNKVKKRKTFSFSLTNQSCDIDELYEQETFTDMSFSDEDKIAKIIKSLSSLAPSEIAVLEDLFFLEGDDEVINEFYQDKDITKLRWLSKEISYMAIEDNLVLTHWIRAKESREKTFSFLL